MALTNFLTNFVNSFDANSKEFESLVDDLMVDNNDVPFDSHEVDMVQNAFVKAVNSRINQGGSDFLPILERILPRCSEDTFSKYCLFWIVNATKVLESVHSSTRDLILACKVLGILVEHSKEIPELHKQVSMQHVKQLINILSSLQPDAKCDAVYYLLAVLLYHYSEICERFQELIRKMILLQIDSKKENLVKASARCYILLSKAMERSFKPPLSKYNVITYNEALLCNNLHAIMDELFSELIELKRIEIGDRLELPSISNKETVQYYKRQKQRFANICIYLSSMLRGYEARNSVLPNDIIRLLCRGLGITPLNLKNKTSFKEQMLCVILPKLHISLFTVLDAFINGFSQELIPNGTAILKLFQQTLQWTSVISENQMTFNDSKPFINVRICAYKCLCSWLINTSSLSGIETIANECVTCILKDITPERDCMLLSMQQKTQHMSKRAIKRFKHSQYENSTILNNGESSLKSGYLDPDLCKEALVALQNILFSSNVLLKQMVYKNIQNTVIPLLYNLYLGSAEQNFYKSHNVCRLELFRVLKALQMNPHVALAFPIQYCLEISHMAAYDIDLNIIQEAKLASAELEKIIHPIAPTLKLSRQEESNNELVSESQIEEIVTTNISDTNRSDKRNRSEEELIEDTDAILFIPKRPKIIVTQCEIIQNENEIELTKEVNSMDVNKSQADDKPYEEIEEEETENALQEQDKQAAIPFIPKRPKIIVTQCEIIQNENEIELTKKVNSMDVNKSQADDKPYEEIEEEEIENALQEQDKQAANKEQSQLNIDIIPNVTTENKEYELAAPLNINTDKQKQHEESEDLMSCIDKEDKSVEKSSKISEKEQKIIQENPTKDDPNPSDSDDDMVLNLFLSD